MPGSGHDSQFLVDIPKPHDGLGKCVLFPELIQASGGEFGPGFDPDDVRIEPWGALELDLQCTSGVASFTPTEEGFPAGTLNPVRLTLLRGLSCHTD